MGSHSQDAENPKCQGRIYHHQLAPKPIRHGSGDECPQHQSEQSSRKDRSHGGPLHMPQFRQNGGNERNHLQVVPVQHGDDATEDNDDDLITADSVCINQLGYVYLFHSLHLHDLLVSVPTS